MRALPVLWAKHFRLMFLSHALSASTLVEAFESHTATAQKAPEQAALKDCTCLQEAGQCHAIYAMNFIEVPGKICRVASRVGNCWDFQAFCKLPSATARFITDHCLHASSNSLGQPNLPVTTACMHQATSQVRQVVQMSGHGLSVILAFFHESRLCPSSFSMTAQLNLLLFDSASG